MKKPKSYQEVIGETIEQMRLEKGWTQGELAEATGTSQSAIHRIEKGGQNISLEMVKKLSVALGNQILSINDSVSQSFRIRGGKELSGEITVNTSKNAAVALLMAALLNSGRTVLHKVARIEEVFRIIEVLESIGVKCHWQNRHRDLEIISPRELKLDNMDIERERGITIKSQAVTIPYTAKDGHDYELNFVDTPGHVDFSYEVSRAIASCEGALLLIDASQGVESQTVSNMYMAVEQDLTIVPVVNKIDLPSADIPSVKEQIVKELGLDDSQTQLVSAKTGEGIDELLEIYPISKLLNFPMPIPG
mgnify:CR=1 FL=1